MGVKEILLVKYGEIILKGLNRSKFENMLESNIKRTAGADAIKEMKASQAIIYIIPAEGVDIDALAKKISKVFGILSIIKAGVFPKDMDVILSEGVEYVAPFLKDLKTFKVEAKRSDKKFPYNSPEISRLMGGEVLAKCHHLKVNVNEPDTVVRVEIRDNEAYVFADSAVTKGLGGMPVRSNGRATLLISGGIDSPVAGWMMAKRGVEIEAVHFCSPPYTSELAKEKVISLAKILAQYTGGYTLYIVPFTEQQLAIRDNCPEEHLTLVMRRMMMKVAEKIAQRNKSQALITGESLGQVASQTIEALGVTTDAVNMNILRPLIGMDKEEIITIARKIGTFETSILPYEDCCTVFVPKHPTTRPKIESVLKSEGKIDMEYWVNKAVEETEWMRIEAE
ncbi:MAG: tRNA 4-thiouridine(8) synthase ThiI [Clostridia bacterium]|nr:tRNA 4-thiouridine(8) synthase ThiI [Clostridia bacterium]